MPTAPLVARLRAAFAPPTEVELILDGHPGPTPTGRIHTGFSVVFGRGVSADHVIAERVVEAFRALGPVDSDMVLVVSDDREVKAQALRNGCPRPGHRVARGAPRRARRCRRAPGAPRSVTAARRERPRDAVVTLGFRRCSTPSASCSRG